MKKLLTILFFFISSELFAPESHVTTLLLPDPLRPYDCLLNAIIQVESGGDRFAIGDRHLKKHSYGILQIRESRLKDYDKRTGKNYTVKDLFDKEISKEIFFYYCRGDYETVSRNWNGGSMGMNKRSTKKYWEKVSKMLISFQ